MKSIRKYSLLMFLIWMSFVSNAQCDTIYNSIEIPNGYFINSQSVLRNIDAQDEIEISFILYAGVDYLFNIQGDGEYRVFLKKPGILQKGNVSESAEQDLISRKTESDGVFQFRTEFDQRIFVNILGKKDEMDSNCRGVILLERKQ